MAKKTRAAATANPPHGLWPRAAIVIVCGVLGLALALAFAGQRFATTATPAHTAGVSDAARAGYELQLNQAASALRDNLTALARTELARTALSGDAAASGAATVQLADLLRHALRVDVFEIGAAQVDPDAKTPITYAGLDLIKRAEAGTFAGPEVIVGNRGIVNAAAPIRNGDAVAGVLFAAVDLSYFSGGFSIMPKDLGEVTVQQSVDGTKPVTVMRYGDPAADATPLTAQLTVPEWTMAFTPGTRTAQQLFAWRDLVEPLLIGLALILGSALFVFSRLGRDFVEDAKQLTGFATELMRGRSPVPKPHHLAVFDAIGNQLMKRAQLLKKSRPARPDTQVADAPAAKPKPKPKAVPAAQPEAATGTSDTDDVDDFLDIEGGSDATENFGIEVDDDLGPMDIGLELDPDIFRAYDIRGITSENLTEDVVYWIGRAFAAEALANEHDRAAIGRDGRFSSRELAASLARGLTEGGMDVIDVGRVPTPLLYFATHSLNTGTGIMITGSHNPPEYNGLKMVLGGEALAGKRITELRERIENNDLSQGDGQVEDASVKDTYLEEVVDRVVVAQPLKVVVDCGNGVAGAFAPALLEQLGCDVVPLYCEVDGNFPNHHPDPAEPENLEDLIAVVEDEQADLGLAFDGDGDRLGVVTDKGTIIWPDKLLMLFAQDVISRNPGADVIYDVKCSRHLNTLISDHGGRPIMWKTGHSHIKAKIKETGALLAGEFSGHICFAERWYGFDDALYAAARLLEIIGGQSESVDDLFSQFPATVMTPEIKIQTTESKKFKILEDLQSKADFGGGTITSIDGIRVDYEDGWGLIRCSNTSPVLSLRFEADSEDAMTRIRDTFRDQLAAVDSSLTFD